MSDARLNELQPWLVPYATYLAKLGAPFGVQVTSVRRTPEKQAELYAAAQRGESRYPAARPGTSMHEFGRAFDMVGHPAVLAWLGKVWESMGGTYGARFGDPIHFEA